MLLLASCGGTAVTELPAVRTAGGVEMLVIPAGEFHMGSERGEADEAPAHRVHIDAFLMDRLEVTQEQLAALQISDPSHFKGPRNPVDNVTWVEAALFCNARSRAEGLQPAYDEATAACDFGASGYRLPTEAEWEYACRAGSRGAYSFGSDPRLLQEHGWFTGNSAGKTHQVGSKKPNPWGLFDMHGNVAEWCNDPYDPDYYASSPSTNPPGPASGMTYVVRGGAWSSRARALRSAARGHDRPGFSDACLAPDTLGFRCVRKVPTK